jgi:hypothetical protein
MTFANEISGNTPQESEPEYFEGDYRAGHDTGCCTVCATRIYDLHDMAKQLNSLLDQLQPLIDSVSSSDISKIASPMGLLSLLVKTKR